MYPHRIDARLRREFWRERNLDVLSVSPASNFWSEGRFWTCSLGSRHEIPKKIVLFTYCLFLPHGFSKENMFFLARCFFWRWRIFRNAVLDLTSISECHLWRKSMLDVLSDPPKFNSWRCFFRPCRLMFPHCISVEYVLFGRVVWSSHMEGISEGNGFADVLALNCYVSLNAISVGIVFWTCCLIFLFWVSEEHVIVGRAVWFFHIAFLKTTFLLNFVFGLTGTFSGRPVFPWRAFLKHLLWKRTWFLNLLCFLPRRISDKNMFLDVPYGFPTTNFCGKRCEGNLFSHVPTLSWRAFPNGGCVFFRVKLPCISEGDAWRERTLSYAVWNWRVFLTESVEGNVFWTCCLIIPHLISEGNVFVGRPLQLVHIEFLKGTYFLCTLLFDLPTLYVERERVFGCAVWFLRCFRIQVSFVGVNALVFPICIALVFWFSMLALRCIFFLCRCHSVYRFFMWLLRCVCCFVVCMFR